ncbi:hypothetical protein ACOYW6_06495 [Parablastomonas sp. CN1-191]|uniref:hypothetical protein n=1 Tax=Parablastomonas sp. CN1-191 TaxID=3400908 RepID=UPI003BF888CE
MIDDPRPVPVHTPPASGRGRLLFAAVLLLAGALLVGWLGWSGRLHTLRDLMARPSAVPTQSAAALPPPTPAATVAPADAVAGFDRRLAALETQLAQIGVAAQAASGNVSRAERLLVAFAARRAVERGVAMGDIEPQLRLRFEESHPQAVAAVLAAAASPVTQDQLESQLDAIAPDLSGASDSGWARFRREVGTIFTIRRDGRPSPRPVDRVEHARHLLASGNYDGAADEIARLPDAARARDWIAAARRFGAAEKALDLIETAALLEPGQPLLPALQAQPAVQAPTQPQAQLQAQPVPQTTP